MLRRGEITIDKRPRRNGTKRYPPPEARIKINSRGSSFSLHRDRGRKGEKERVQQDSFSFFLSRPRLNYPNHLSTTTWRFKLINLCAFWILSNLRACTGCVITCSHEPAFMLTLVMHYVINAQHRAQETPTVHSCACCSLLYGIYLPFPISFLSLSLSLTFLHAFMRPSNSRTSSNTRYLPPYLPFLPPRNRSEFERAVHAFYFIAR